MRTKFLLIINTINVILFILVISLFLKKHIGLNGDDPLNLVATKVTNVHDIAMGKSVVNENNDLNIDKEPDVVVENIDDKFTSKEIKDNIASKEVKDNKKNNEQLNKKIKEMEKELVSELNEIKANNKVQVVDMKNHTNDKFKKVKTIEQNKNITIYLDEKRVSKQFLKPNTEVLVSTTNYGEFFKVINPINKKVYLVKKGDIVE